MSNSTSSTADTTGTTTGPDSQLDTMVRCASYHNNYSAWSHAQANKRAVEAVTIIFFIIYVILTIVAYVMSIVKKDNFIAYAAKKLMNEIAYKFWYIFFLIAMYHVIEPWAFPTIMLWIQLILVLVHCVMHFVFGRKLKWVLIITYAIVNLFAIILTIILLADNWCRFFKF